MLALKEKVQYRIPQVKPYESFEEIPGIPVDLLQSLKRHGFLKPTQLQGNLLYHYFGAGKTDLMVRGWPGSGKSVGYLIALMAKTGDQVLGHHLPRHLVLVPTEQLQLQLQETLKSFNASSNDAILVAQPDAIALKLAQGTFNWKGLETIVLDEADALIKPLKRHSTATQKRSRIQHPVPTLQLLTQLWSLFRADPVRKGLRPRLVVCSATLNRGTKDSLMQAGITHDSGRACISIDIPEKERERVSRHKHLLLSDSESVDELIEKLKIPLLKRSGKKAILLPADQSKIGMISLLKERFGGELKFGLLSEGWQEDVDVLVGSDVDVRGLNIPDLQHVIILDLPRSATHFTHMAGRVGRNFNPEGTVWTILGTAKDYERYSSMLSQLGILSLPVAE